MIPRDRYLDQLISWKDKEPIKIITGVRRCGKSTLLGQFKDYLQEQSKKDSIIYINFEDLRNEIYLDYKKLYDYCMECIDNNINGNKYFLFDEVQLVPSWEKAINSLRLDKNVDIYITGSNAHLLSSELSTLLGGRYVTMLMLPFSYKEAKQYKEGMDFNEYLKYGSFPGIIALQSEQQKWTYLDDLTDSILFKDVMLRNNLDDPELLKNLCSFVYDTIGNLISVRKITNKLSSSGKGSRQETVSKYLKYLVNAYLIFEVQRYDIKGKEILSRNPKYYGIDMGIRNIITSPASENLGSVIENIVFLELLRLGYTIHVGTINNLEVDFIAIKDGIPIYIQVSLSAIDENTAKREFTPLFLIEDNYPKYLITTDTLNLSRKGIKHINLERFLLNGFKE